MSLPDRELADVAPIAAAAVVASWLDPGENGWDVGDVSLLLGVVVVVGGVMLGTWRLVIRSLDKRIEAIAHRLDERLTEATKPIQKNANGGLSLPDVARSTDWTRDAIKALAAAHGIDLPPDPLDRSSTH